MKKLSTLLAFFSLFLSLCAQPDSKLAQAFKESYASETINNYETAVKALENVYVPTSYELNLRLGWLHYLKGDYPISLKYYQKARKLLPYSFEAKLGYVLPLVAMGNWDEVITVYEKIIEADPQNTLVNYRLGAIYYERKEYKKAHQYTEKVVNLYPFDADSVILFAWINLKMARSKEAEVLFNKALLILPDNASAIEGLKLLQ